MEASHAQFKAIYDFCDPKQSIEKIVDEVVDMVVSYYEIVQVKGVVHNVHTLVEGDYQTDMESFGDPTSYIGVVNLTDRSDYQGGNIDFRNWPEPPRMGNFGDMIGDPNKPHQPLWTNEDGTLVMFPGTEQLCFRTQVSEKCERLFVEVKV